jgi:hypothetical protein
LIAFQRNLLLCYEAAYSVLLMFGKQLKRFALVVFTTKRSVKLRCDDVHTDVILFPLTLEYVLLQKVIMRIEVFS